MPFYPTTHPNPHPITRSIIMSVTIIMLAGVAYLFWPMYGFIAESNASLRKPWAWTEVPAADICHSSPIDAAWRSTADRACALLLEHQAMIHAPSLSAAVAVDGKLVWSAAVGWSDLAAMKPATPETLYRIGSTSKPVTGTLLARLVDAGLVTLDEPIGNHDDALTNPDWNALTLRQLASHTAGLPEYETNRDWRGVYHSMALQQPHANVRQGLALFDGNPLRYTPGSDFEYSSFGTLLIASVLQNVGGQPFESLIQEWALAPLALDSPRADQAAPDRARFYQLDGSRAQPWRSVDQRAGLCPDLALEQCQQIRTSRWRIQRRNGLAGGVPRAVTGHCAEYQYHACRIRPVFPGADRVGGVVYRGAALINWRISNAISGKTFPRKRVWAGRGNYGGKVDLIPTRRYH